MLTTTQILAISTITFTFVWWLGSVIRMWIVTTRENKQRELQQKHKEQFEKWQKELHRYGAVHSTSLPPEIKKDMALYMNKSLYEDMFTDALAHSLDRMAQAQIDKATATPKEYNHANLSKGDFVHSASKSITLNGTSGTSVTMSDYALPTISFKGGPTEAVVNPARVDISYDIDGQRMMMYDGNGWVELSAEPVRKKEKRPTNCPNCGAPVRGSVCEYCGTTF